MRLIESIIFEKFSFVRKEDFNYEFNCEEGWTNLLYDTFDKLKKAKFDGRVVKIDKEYGGLYIEIADYNKLKERTFLNILSRANELSYVICEYCGNSGIAYTVAGSYFQILCDMCYENLSQIFPVFNVRAGVEGNGKAKT